MVTTWKHWAQVVDAGCTLASQSSARSALPNMQLVHWSQHHMLMCTALPWHASTGLQECEVQTAVYGM